MIQYIGRDELGMIAGDGGSRFEGKRVRTNRDIQPVRRGIVVKSCARKDCSPQVFVRDYEGRIFVAEDKDLVLDD